MGGAWIVTEARCAKDTRGFCVEDLAGYYQGAVLATVTPCGNNWTRLEAVVRPPPANATVNGTALQLRLAAPQTPRGWGAQVWIGAASVVAM